MEVDGHRCENCLDVVHESAAGSYACRQESRLRADVAGTAIAAARQDGRSIAMAEALDAHKLGEAADGSYTLAGVAICVLAHHGITRAGGHAGWDAPPPQPAGRLALARCTLVDGIVQVNVYVYTVK